ncbi:MAG: hypothetical protein II950_06110 [Prevotella sp.]|nr:hypothetical protein [Prevotella sp.]
MIIIRNSLLPFGKFTAMNIFGIMLCRKNAVITRETINHERIHTAQLIETGFIGFYVWYVIEWLVKLPFRGNAYRKISFEREAYDHMDDMDYLSHRKHYAWCKLLRIKS